MRFNTVSELQHKLKADIVQAVNGRLAEICMEIVRNNVREKGYIQNDQTDYDRTWELLNSVTIGNLSVGYKYIGFEVFMDAEKIDYNITGDGEWNQHASMKGEDKSEQIPLWVEKGTKGSLWDRPAGNYMQHSTSELGDGRLAEALANELRKEGWKVVRV
ncbi:hypothetical protein [Peribacillus asahii]|uniref:hypothetical protein n=1 Tax=Peribacillus asahii TaxID=228899 RepID=UPI003808B205